MAYFEHDDCTLHYEEYGQGTPVVLVHGLGFAWLPRHLIERELREGVLKPLPLDQGGSRHPLFYLYSNKDKPLGPATQILIELLRNFDTAPLDVPFAAPAQA